MYCLKFYLLKFFFYKNKKYEINKKFILTFIKKIPWNKKFLKLICIFKLIKLKYY